jgi:hypothetical protein
MPKVSLYSKPVHPLVTVDSIVEALVLTNKLDRHAQDEILSKARKAILKGELQSHDAQTTALIKNTELATPLVTYGEFKAWAEKEGMTLKLPSLKTKKSRQKPPVTTTGNWKLRIQSQATKHMLHLRKHGANPTVLSILKDIHTWCVQNDIRTPRGVIPTEGYIRTHALGGRYWSPPL